MTSPSLVRTIAAAGLLLLMQLTPANAGTVTDDGRIKGSADAPITLIEYSDFTCAGIYLPLPVGARHAGFLGQSLQPAQPSE